MTACGNDELRSRSGSKSSTSPLSVNSACTLEYNPVCAQPPMPVCQTGMACIQVMPAPKTFNNECEMEKAEAQFISNGICP